MAIKLEDKVNVTGPNAQFPYGQIKNDPGDGTGTPVDLQVYGDFHQFFARMLDLSGLTINDLPDDDINGFQYYEALLATKTNLGLQNQSDLKYREGFFDFNNSFDNSGLFSITTSMAYYEGNVCILDVVSLRVWKFNDWRSSGFGGSSFFINGQVSDAEDFFITNGRVYVLDGAAQTVFVYEFDTGAHIPAEDIPVPNSNDATNIFIDSNVLFVSYPVDDEIRQFNVTTKALISIKGSAGFPFGSFVLGDTVYYGTSGNGVRAFDRNTLADLTSLWFGSGFLVNAFDIKIVGKKVYVSGPNQTIAVYDIHDGTLLFTETVENAGTFSSFAIGNNQCYVGLNATVRTFNQTIQTTYI